MFLEGQMALFKKACQICGAECIDKNLNIGGISVCNNCYWKAYYPQDPFSLKVEELAEHIKYREKNLELMKAFTPQEELNLTTCRILYNDSARQFYFMNAAQRRIFEERGSFSNVPIPYLYSYDSIQGYDYYENDSQIVSKDGVGKAVGGAVLFGVAGAIVGNAMRHESSNTQITNMRVSLLLDNPYQSVAEFVFKHGNGVTYGSADYIKLKQQADLLLGLFDHMAGKDDEKNGQPKQEGCSSKPFSPSDEIMKLKSMLDEAIITEEEFATMKQKLISQM